MNEILGQASNGNIYYIYILIGILVALLLVIIIMSYLLVTRRQRLLLEEKALHFQNMENLSLQQLVDEAERQKLNKPLDVSVGSGNYKIDKELNITAPIRLMGQGARETQIEVKGNGPAMNVKDVKDCSVSNMTIKGSIRCMNSELQIENCQIIANEEGICIEAQDNSTVTVSGLVRGEGGIAIRAHGESKVILKQPYIVSGEDYVVMDPKSSVTVEKEKELPEPDKAEQVKEPE